MWKLVISNAAGAAMMLAGPVCCFVAQVPLLAAIALGTVGFILFRKTYEKGCPFSPKFLT